MTTAAAVRIKPKKLLERRHLSRWATRSRPAVQIAFLILNLWMGVQFWLFVRQFEIPGAIHSTSRPAGVEGWLPIAGLMNWKSFLLTGKIPLLHPATMFLLGAFLVISWLMRKAFCSWLCPVGTVSEWLWKLGRKIFGRMIKLPQWLDIGLRGLKYILLGLFASVVITMSVESIHAFLGSPYGVIADVKMLNFFRNLGPTGAVVIAILVAASVVVKNFWCRYLCPYGAMMGLAALTSPMRIVRNPITCIDCAKCAKACPSSLPVDRLTQIRSAECLGCMECVNECPSEGALDLYVLRKQRVQPWMIAAGVAVIFLGTVSFAKIAGHWDSPISFSTYERLIPHASEFDHPR